MRKYSLTFVLIACLSALAWGQSKREWLQFGDDAFNKGDYASAAVFYYQVINPGAGGREGNVVFPYEVRAWYGSGKIKNDTTSEKGISNQEFRQIYVINQIAESYRRNHDYDKALEWYEKAIQYQSPKHPNARYWYARVLMNFGRYDEAEKELEAFMKDASEMSATYKLAQQAMFGCYYAKDPASSSEGITIKKSDSIINSGRSVFAAGRYGDDNSLMISAAKTDGTVDDPKKEDPSYRSDIYVLNAATDGWTTPAPLPPTINTGMNEGAGALSIDRSTFYFTRWTPDNPNECAIYVSRYFNYQWLQPMRLNNSVNAVGYISKHPALVEDGSGLYFSSNRPGGQGGFDIWFVPLDDYGNLGEAVNMGTEINTPGDEVSPFYHYYTKTLYYASDGLPGMGGLDLFRSSYDEDNQTWSQPTNVGRPINSVKDDLFFGMNDQQTQGYFTSNREACTDCNKDNTSTAYCMKIYELTKPTMEFSIRGTVFNAETEAVIPNALVTFKDIRGNFEPFFIMTDEKGNYERELKEGWDLFLKAQKVKYFGDAASISTVGLVESKHFQQDFFLTPIPAGEIEIPGIEYDFDKATLRPESKKILDDLVQFLTLNNNIIIEIRSHTDERGSDAYNLRLSEERAKSVVNYLVANGIDRDRLRPKGYGESQPLFPNAKTEEQNQRNRRTAFKTLDQNYKDVFNSK